MRRRVRPSSRARAEQALAVERHRRRRVVRAREEIGPEPLRRVVPDLGAVQRQHDRLAAPRAPAAPPAPASRPLLWTCTTSARSIAGCERLADARAARTAPSAQRPRDAAVGAPRDPGRRPGQRRRLPGPRRMGDVLDRVAGLGRPRAELPRQQRVGRLVRRQVRRDVDDVHRRIRRHAQ